MTFGSLWVPVGPCGSDSSSDSCVCPRCLCDDVEHVCGQTLVSCSVPHGEGTTATVSSTCRVRAATKTETCCSFCFSKVGKAAKDRLCRRVSTTRRDQVMEGWSMSPGWTVCLCAGCGNGGQSPDGVPGLLRPAAADPHGGEGSGPFVFSLSLCKLRRIQNKA